MNIRDLPGPVPTHVPRRRTAGLILLIEDDFVLRSSLSELLEEEGFRVECCADGRDGFRRLHESPKPDLILLDVMLPHLDGYEFRALQRRVPGFASIPVIVMSAYHLDRATLDELELPVSFRKPLDVEQLVSTMRELSAPDA
jgi:CheY-like chemotaxis protein